jgi:hypothetical protein
VFIENRAPSLFRAFTLCGPDGRKILRFCNAEIEFLSPGLKPSEAFMILDYRRKRDLE